MFEKTLSSMRVTLAKTKLAGQVVVPLDDFMKFDLEISRELNQLENRFHDFTSPFSLLQIEDIEDDFQR